MKKFLFVALIGGALVACNDTSNTVNGVDTTTQAYKDSVAAASGSMMSTPSTDTGMSTTPMIDSASKMMDTSSNKMMGDSMK